MHFYDSTRSRPLNTVHEHHELDQQPQIERSKETPTRAFPFVASVKGDAEFVSLDPEAAYQKNVERAVTIALDQLKRNGSFRCKQEKYAQDTKTIEWLKSVGATADIIQSLISKRRVVRKAIQTMITEATHLAIERVVRESLTTPTPIKGDEETHFLIDVPKHSKRIYDHAFKG